MKNDYETAMEKCIDINEIQNEIMENPPDEWSNKFNASLVEIPKEEKFSIHPKKLKIFE